MIEFKGKQFYGFSMEHNPNLKTTTKNFEFRYVNPEYLEKVIQKVQKDLKDKQHFATQNDCRMSTATTEIKKQHVGILRKDLDEETQTISFLRGTKQGPTLSEREVDIFIDKAKHNLKSYIRCNSSHREGHTFSPQNPLHKCDTASTVGSETYKYDVISRNTNFPEKPQQKDETFVKIGESNSKNFTSLCTSITNNNFEPQLSIAQTPQIIDNVLVEEYRRPQPKWVEIEEPKKESLLEIEIKYNIPASAKPKSVCYNRHDENVQFQKVPIQKYSQNAHCMSDGLMTEVISRNELLADEFRTDLSQNKSTENMDNYIVEDSDLEYEIVNRSQFNKNEMLNLSVDGDQNCEAEFIEIESGMAEIDEQFFGTDNILDEDLQCRNVHSPLTRGTAETSNRSLSPQVEPLPLKSKPTPTLRQHLQQTFERLAGGTSSRSATPRNCLTQTSTLEPSRSGRFSRSRPKCSSPNKESTVNNISARSKNTGRQSERSVVTKSIEDLKKEKTRIFNKMTAIQEKMIDILDKLRISLLLSNAPENIYEKTKRQKNAFEFSVRFSRNFLYPLKGMKEDLQLTSVEQFNSLNSNEACNRICYMYSLLLQSLNTYQKQMRFFLLDHVHQNLVTLIELIFSITTLCLEKEIFSKHDVIVDCLQQRCLKISTFLRELNSERQQIGSQSHRQLPLEKAHTKYDSKMCMNDLNMYGPKLVSKPLESERSTKSKKKKAKRPIKQVTVEKSMENLAEKPPEDAIPTQIQGISDNKSSVSLQNSQLNMACGDGSALDMKELQNLTKEQVKLVVDSIMDYLGPALGDQHNSETIETLLNAMKVKQVNNLEFDNKCEKQREIETMKTVELSSVDSLRNRTCKPLKAAKQTKTLRQQNSHGTHESKKRSSTTTGIIVGNDDDDDDVDNNKNDSNNNKNTNSKNNNNNNNKSSSSKRNSTTHLRSTAGGGGGAGGGGVGGERYNKANHMRATTKKRTLSKKITNKSKKLMNEDQIDEQVRQRKPEEDLQSYRNPQSKEIQSDISTSDREGDPAPNSRKHLNPKPRYTLPNTKKHRLESYGSCSPRSTSSSSSHHSQCQMASNPRSSSKILLPHRNSLLCLQTGNSKSRSTKKKRDQTPPPAPSAQLSASSGNITENKANSKLYQIPLRRNVEENVWIKLNSLADASIPPSEKTTILKTGRASGNESDFGDFKEQRSNVDCDIGSIQLLGAGRVTQKSLGASCGETSNKSSEYFLRIKSSKQKYRQKGNTASPSNATENMSQNIKNLNDPPTRQDGVKSQPTDNINCKPNKNMNDTIKERDRFLELCKKNRFYSNPNFSEPWKVFSSISERLLNDVLYSVETDFDLGVSKFVDDFLELEFKTK